MDEYIPPPPASIGIMKFVECRKKELTELELNLGVVKGNKRIFQLLPKHMRRRAMSHHAARVPRAIKEKHILEMASLNMVKNKMPSRKHRRRPKNLLLDYNRRQRKYIWLETHIWHAKRFKMIEQWGYKLPLHSYDKGFRATYRSVSEHCVLQDISYYVCVELVGTESILLNGLQQMTSTSCGLTFAAKFYLEGTREGSLMLYSPNCFPFKALGKITFMWKPRENDTDTRHLWIWIHPSCYKLIIDELLQLFDANITEICKIDVFEKLLLADPNDKKLESGTEAKNPKKKRKIDNSTAKKGKSSNKNQDKSQLDHAQETLVDKKLLPKLCEGVQTYRNDKTNVTILLLKDNLVRMRLTGPMSNIVLADSLHILNLEESTSKNTSETSSSIKTPWWKKLQLEDRQIKFNKNQREMWGKMRKLNSSEVPPYCVLSLIVKDPRLFLPTYKKKSMHDYDDEEKKNVKTDELSAVEGISHSYLWDQNVRNEVTMNKLPELEINKIRSQNLVPEKQLDLDEKESKIPILLVHNSGSQLNFKNDNQAYSSGWDIIIPIGWGMPFWMNFIYRGARVGALRDTRNFVREQGQLCFPYDFPDTPSGKESESLVENELIEKYFRYPPNKRPNYIKLNMYPFTCSWTGLLAHWTSMESCVDSFYVLRNKKQLKVLATMCERYKQKNLPSQSARDCKKLFEDIQSKNCLVAVHIEMIGKGIPDEFSIICLPTVEDSKNLKTDNSFSPEEPLHKDPYKEKRKEIKKIKKKLKKSVNKKETNEITEPVAKIIEENENKFYFPNGTDVLQNNSKRVIGFVKTGNYLLSGGITSGIGYVAISGLFEMFNLNKTSIFGKANVLIRSSNATKYRFANLSVL